MNMADGDMAITAAPPSYVVLYEWHSGAITITVPTTVLVASSPTPSLLSIPSGDELIGVRDTIKDLGPGTPSPIMSHDNRGSMAAMTGMPVQLEMECILIPSSVKSSCIAI